MRALVTGASGFIGRHLVRRLLKEKYKVRCLVRKNSNVNGLIDVELVYGDLLDKDSLKKAVDGVDMVYHLGAVGGIYGVPRKIVYDVNVNGTRNIIEESYKAKIKKFIHFSTFSVYGYTEKPANEETPQKGLTSYFGKTKRMGEKIVKEYMQKGMDAVIIQPTVTYGPGLNLGFVNMFSAIKNKKFCFIGNGNNFLHLCYIDNLMDGIILVSRGKKAIGQTYLIGDETPLMFKDIVGCVAENLRVNIPKIYLPIWLARTAVPYLKFLAKLIKQQQPLLTYHRINYMSKNQFANISKIKRELGFKPKISSREGLKLTIEDWMKSN